MKVLLLFISACLYLAAASPVLGYVKPSERVIPDVDYDVSTSNYNYIKGPGKRYISDVDYDVSTANYN